MKVMSLVIAIVLSSGLSAQAYDSKPTKKAAAPTATSDIVDTAVAAGQFTTLAAALKAADLVTTLKGKGPFTVFAPTDEAFKKIPQETLEKLLKPENKATLVKVLTYHVVAGQILAKDVKAGAAKSVEKSDLIISTDGGVKINGLSNVTATDIKATNGVIHIIDTVVVPTDVKLNLLK
jgi:uncharacterized surface protein with fasciclin (FAS1) repeats